jgi:tetratricopeptide (TPR) repeat protein
MSNGSHETDLLELEAAINFLYDTFTAKTTNHFELLGLATNATHKEIETAYRKYSEEFSPQRIAMLSNPESRKKGNFLITRGKQAFETLSDFQKRAEYEKRGFRDPSPQDIPEDTDEEKAKNLFKKAKSFKTMKDYNKVILALKEAIKLDPNKPAYYLMLGQSMAQFPQYKKEAEYNLQKAAELESWNAEPFYELGMLFYSEKLLKRAEGFFRKALELEPNHNQARIKLEIIVGPEKKFLDVAQEKLGKVLPSIFGKKK